MRSRRQLKDSNKASYEEQKRKSIAESFEQSGKSNQAIRKDIQHDDKMLASNYNKILKMLLFLKHITKESRVG
jgi:ATP-binding cassette subfamily F protein 3